MSSSEQFEMIIPSDTTRAQELQEKIVSHMENFAYPEKDVFGVRLSLEEALMNAIKHGNGMNPNKSVRVECTVTSDEICIVIEDEGEGFSLDTIPDPTADENLEKPCGRGIMLMRAFLSHVEYNETGNRVVLQKIRSDVSSPS